MILLSALAALSLSPEAEPSPLRLSLVGVGRFAVLADTASITPDGDGVRMRSLQVSEEDMPIGEARYIGGWSWWRFDCAARTADRLDFASLKDDLTEGPAMAVSSPPYPVVEGGDAAELFAVACGEVIPPLDATTLAQAVDQARKAMAD